MNIKLLKRIVIFLIIILVIVFIAILMAVNNLNKKNKDNIYGEGGVDIVEGYGKNTTGGIDYQSYFDVKSCIQRYLNVININNNEYKSYDKQGNQVYILKDNEIKQKIYNLLSNKYINKNNITIEKIYDYVKVLQEQCIFIPVETSLIQDGDIKSFLTYGLIQSSKDYSLIDKIFAVVNINIVEGTFSVEPIYGEYKSINDINVEKFEKNITSNEDNEFHMSYAHAEDFPVEYINVYKGLALGAPEKLYNLLDEEYRIARFGSFDKFKNYIEKNKAKISTVRLDKYKVDVNGTKVRYICIDQYENYYVINQNEILQDYTIMLDTYTIDLQEFIEKYDKSKNHEKMILNVQKLKEAIKNNDYTYVYNKLNTSFKESKFKTQASFEKYIKANYNENNTMEYVNYEELTGVHVYTVKIKDKNTNKTTKAKIAMKLNDKRDFEFSFSIEN